MTRRWVSDIWEEWDPERNEGLRRMAEALKPPPVPEAPEPRQKAEVASEVIPEQVAAPEPSTGRRERIAQLVAAVRAGDLSAVDLLRKALDRD